MKSSGLSLLIVGLLTLSAHAGPDLSKLPPPSTKTGLTFEKDIKPIFQSACTRCHGSNRAKGGLHLDTLNNVLTTGDNGPDVIPGKSADSPLVIAIARIDPDSAMPPSRGGGGGNAGRAAPGGPGGPRGGDARSPGDLLAQQMMTDANAGANGTVSHDQFVALAAVWFTRMDANQTGKVDLQQLSSTLSSSVMPGANRRQGASRRGGGRTASPLFSPLFNAIDTDQDGAITATEMKAAFVKWAAAWDVSNSGSLTQQQIAAGLNQILPRPASAMRGEGRGREREHEHEDEGDDDEDEHHSGGRRGGSSTTRPDSPAANGGSNSSRALTAEQVGIIRAWIDQGAK